MDITVERKGYDLAIIEWDEPGLVQLYKQDNDAAEPIYITETNAGIYVDEDPKLSNNNPLYYISKNGVESVKMRLDSRGDNYQYAIADNYLWQLRYLPRGFAAKAYLKALHSVHCPECWNETLGKQIKTVCETCDGTGLLGSIKGPVDILIGIAQRKKEKLYEEVKEREEETITAWTGNYPYLKQSDIIYFNGLLYIVQYIPNYIYMPSELGNEPFMVRQEFQLIRLDRNNELSRKLMVQ